MKPASFSYLLAVAVVLSLTAVGCHKGLDKTTQIPKGSVTEPRTEAASPPRESGLDRATPPPRDTAPPVVADPTLLKPENIAQSNKDFDSMDANREMFAAQTVHFEFDKSNVKPGDIPKLEDVARRMKAEFQGKCLRIEGHCDERGTEEYNRALGDRRALSTREKLVQLGVDPETIQTMTLGEEKPMDMGHNEAAWSKNRRAELILLTPKGSK